MHNIFFLLWVFSGMITNWALAGVCCCSSISVSVDTVIRLIAPFKRIDLFHGRTVPVPELQKGPNFLVMRLIFS